MSFINRLHSRGIKLQAPKFLYDNIHYECIMGSQAYGCSQEDSSDWDIYGFCIPPKEEIFPHLKGEIIGFGKQHQRFEQYQQHHIEDKDAGKQYDLTIYSIVKYFQLVMENNPNMIDSLFVPQNLILNISRIGNIVRENRRMFLHKGSFYKFKGYAFSQLHRIDKIDEKQNDVKNNKRKESIDKYGYDIKQGYHVYRLADECEQILQEGDLDLQRSKEILKSIRRGEWKFQDLKDYFTNKEKYLEKLYEDSKLPYSPDEERIKTLLLNCLEEHYGSLDKAIEIPDKYKNAIIQIEEILSKVR